VIDKPSVAEVRALIMREAQARIDLQVTRARAHLRLARGKEKVTYHECRAYAVAATKSKYQAYEEARADLLAAAYGINARLDLMQEHSFGVA
jgi:hypothetical protein